MKKILQTIIVASVFCAGIAIAQEQKLVPETTEIRNQEPMKVTAGINSAPPSDAIILDHSAWQSMDGNENPWTDDNGVMTIAPGTKDIQTKQSFGDVQLHIEWRTPKLDAKFTGQDRGNSGVFLQKFYEIQILDSYTNKTYNNGQAGSIYKQHVPLVNASRPEMEWQSYDVIYTAPRFGKGNSVITPARMTVFHNGVLIHNNVTLSGPTLYRGLPHYERHGKLPITLQDHDHKTSFRNIWIREL